MKILINDFAKFREVYIRIFKLRNYEENELIFVNSFQDAKEFIANFLDNKKLHIDLIITNDSSYTNYDELKATELLEIKNLNISSYSQGNFRICSIPTILYSDNDTKLNLAASDFDAVIKKDTTGRHNYFLDQCEALIKRWRKAVYDDLENLRIKISDLNAFQGPNVFMTDYEKEVVPQVEEYFISKTKIVSFEFIRFPKKLNYDWLVLTNNVLEDSLLTYIKTYKDHVKYDRKNNERTILHNFFRSNKIILLRDVYNEMQYETNLYEINAKNSEECDFILKTEYPEFLRTTFFEVKKEDVKLFVKKNAKRPRFSADFINHLDQIYGYKEFTENPVNEIEIFNKIGYSTSNYDYVLLAGRLEEKEEIKEDFDKKLNRMYNGITVYTYEELEEINSGYLDKFNRLKV